MKHFLLALIVVLAIPQVAFAYTPVEDEFVSAIIYVPSTKKILYSFKPDKQHVAASLTKLVSGLVFLDKHPAWTNRYKSISNDEVGGGRLRVTVGTSLALRDWWNAGMGASVNNATNVFARSTGVMLADFTKKMNAKAKAIGATSSVFYEPTGMNEKNMTTARDMALIAQKAFSFGDIRSATAAAKHTYKIPSTGEERSYATTNGDLVNDSSLYLVGAKTGYLHESMFNLAAELQPVNEDGVRDPKKDVIVVVLGAQTKQQSFDSVKKMAAWAWTQESAFKTVLPGKRLQLGMTDPDVARVQRILAKDKAVYADGRVTGYFGNLTLAAVQAFQRKYNIAKPGVVGYGQVGPKTWEKLVELE